MFLFRQRARLRSHSQESWEHHEPFPAGRGDPWVTPSFGGVDTPFARALLTAGGAAAGPVVEVALSFGIAVVAQEAVVAGIVQLAAPMRDLEALGLGFIPFTPYI